MTLTNRYDRLSALLIGTAHVRYGRGILDPLSADTGISRMTLSRRLESPEKFTLEELHTVANALKIPGERIREVMPF